MYDFDVVRHHVKDMVLMHLDSRTHTKKSSGFVKREREDARVARRRLWISMLRSDRDQVRHICTPRCRISSLSVELSTCADAGIKCEALLF
jgi:hypothetical protein